jgi:diguanylate cyclase (GGDEF)-like protein
LAEEAATDPLTELPNRRAWEAMLAERVVALPSGGRLCVAIVDLDRFKPVNDTHGHTVGDDVLRTAGHALREGLRPDDFVARLGGDEFALLLAVPDASTAQAVVDRVRKRVAAALSDAALPVVTASAGWQVLEVPGESSTPEATMAAADASLREAKQQGRDRTVASS